MTMKLSKLIVGCAFLATLSTSAFAQVPPNLQFDIDSDGRLVVSIQLNNLILHGNALALGNPSQMTIDGLSPHEAGNGSGACMMMCTQENEGGTGMPDFDLIPGWGELEVYFDCENQSAEIFLLKHHAGELVPVFSQTVSTDYCPGE